MSNKKTSYNKVVIGLTSIAFLIIFIISQINEAGFMAGINSILNFLYENLGWFFNLATLFAIFVAVFFLCKVAVVMAVEHCFDSVFHKIPPLRYIIY